MLDVTFNINGTERSGGAEVLTCAAADALAWLDSRNHDGLTVVLGFHPLDGSCGAVVGAVVAVDPFCDYHAVVFEPNGMSHVDGGLFFFADGFDGTSGADLAASDAFRTAVADFERHGGLHEMAQVGGWPQHVVRTSCDA